MLKILAILLLSLQAFADTANFEIGQTRTVFNYFEIPNGSENRVKTDTNDNATTYRLVYTKDVGEKNFLYFLIAPLTVDYSFTSTSAFEFDGEEFDGAKRTDVNYKFNSYRAGYFWRFNWPELQTWIGAVAKIRDARIEVSQPGKENSFSNIGIVPLLGFGFMYQPFEQWALYSHTDALGASQGSAYDASIKLMYLISNKHSVGVGKRILGGGVDNDTLENFAQFDSYTFDYSLNF